jgi:hypothetical protein
MLALERRHRVAMELIEGDGLNPGSGSLIILPGGAACFTLWALGGSEEWRWRAWSMRLREREGGPRHRAAPLDTKESSTEVVAFEYDLFVVHAQADEPFVHGHLLPPSIWHPSA